MSELHIRMLSRLYDIRETARVALGDRYRPVMERGAGMIRDVMESHSCTELEAALKIGKGVAGDDRSTMIMMAALVEMLEPTPT